MNNSYTASADTMKMLLEALVQQYAERNMFRFWGEGHTDLKNLCFSDVLRQTERLGAWFLSQGYEHKHIAIISENSYEWFLAFFAITTSGNTAVLINKSLPEADIKQLLCFNDVSCAFVSDEYSAIAQNVCQANGIDVLTCSVLHEIAKDDLVPEERLERFRRYSVLRSDLAVIAFTSGTMGIQKGVMLSHWNLVRDAYANACAFSRGEKLLSGLPLFHMFGLTANLGVLILGSTVVINQSLRYFVQDILREQPDILAVVPAMLPTIYQIYSQRTPAAGTSIVCGGAAVDPSWVEKFSRFNVSICAGYGMTECAPVIAMSEKDRPYDGFMRVHNIFTVAIDHPDEDGIGEIIVKGDGVTSGYYHMEEETAKVLYDNWMHTGDLGQMRGKHYISVVGRKKNLLVLPTGENISPEVIEQSLLASPIVKECIVSLSADGLIQAEIYAPNGDEKAIRELVNAYNHSCPSAARIMNLLLRTEEFPKNATGKILRKPTKKY